MVRIINTGNNVAYQVNLILLNFGNIKADTSTIWIIANFG